MRCASWIGFVGLFLFFSACAGQETQMALARDLQAQGKLLESGGPLSEVEKSLTPGEKGYYATWAELQGRMALVHAVRGEHARAVKAHKEACNQDQRWLRPERAEARKALAESYARDAVEGVNDVSPLGRIKAGLADLAFAVELDPAAPGIPLARARLSLYGLHAKEALAGYDQVIAAGLKDPRVFQERAEARLRLGLWDAETLRDIERGFEQPLPRYSYGLYYRALCKVGLGDLKGADEDLTLLGTMLELSWMKHMARAILTYRQKGQQAAMAPLRQAFDTRPGEALAFIRRLPAFSWVPKEWLAENGPRWFEVPLSGTYDYPGLIEEATLWVKEEPQAALAHRILSLDALNGKKWETYLKESGQAMVLYPFYAIDARLHFERARAFLETGDALAALAEAQEMADTDQVKARELFTNLENVPAAINRKQPGVASILTSLGQMQTHLREKRYQDLLSAAQSVPLPFRPRSASYHLLVGAAQERLGQLKDALVSASAALAANPARYEALFMRAWLREQLGDKARSDEDSALAKRLRAASPPRPTGPISPGASPR
jgi:tetratricopeptide (TPR) repeat protein